MYYMKFVSTIVHRLECPVRAHCCLLHIMIFALDAWLNGRLVFRRSYTPVTQKYLKYAKPSCLLLHFTRAFQLFA